MIVIVGDDRVRDGEEAEQRQQRRAEAGIECPVRIEPEDPKNGEDRHHKAQIDKRPEVGCMAEQGLFRLQAAVGGTVGRWRVRDLIPSDLIPKVIINDFWY